MHLVPWRHAGSAHFPLTGWHSPPSGKPLLHFVHGNGFCGRVYEPMLKRLAGHFDLWLCDAQGHGETEHGGDFLGWNRTAELIGEAFEANHSRFGDVPRYALGHSFGAVQTALVLASRPQLFRRAVLLDPVFFSKPMLALAALFELLRTQRFNALARKTAARRRQWPDRQAALAQLTGRGIFRGWSDEALRAYVEHALREGDEGVELKCRPSREAEIFASYPRKLWPNLQRIGTPTLVLHGEHSYPFVAASARRLASANAKVMQRMVVGGHCFMQEHPEDAARQSLEFLLPAG
ncbi:alpha/beta fold hydrolase [Pseudomonas sp. LRF_L74]|uniref:alpha/beta fold hydrolase n=1 Tax=Pseudomonas sp. LRF_L74 TaxID=3369422 RepID=UPI003F645AA1